MNEIILLIAVLVIGLLLGLIFYGGLWLTIQNGVTSRQPVLWFLSSFILRTSIVLSGLYYIGHDRWERLLVCLIGFFVARIISTRFIRGFEKSENTTSTSLATEVKYAP